MGVEGGSISVNSRGDSSWTDHREQLLRKITPGRTTQSYIEQEARTCQFFERVERDVRNGEVPTWARSIMNAILHFDPFLSHFQIQSTRPNPPPYRSGLRSQCFRRHYVGVGFDDFMIPSSCNIRPVREHETRYDVKEGSEGA